MSEGSSQQVPSESSAGLSAEAIFEQRSDRELSLLLDALIDSQEEVDPDLESGVLSIHFDDDDKYVVNSHRAARQIWMAAQRQAWHFDYVDSKDQWIASNGDELWSAVNRVLSLKLGSQISLTPGDEREGR